MLLIRCWCVCLCARASMGTPILSVTLCTHLRAGGQSSWLASFFFLQLQLADSHGWMAARPRRRQRKTMTS